MTEALGFLDMKQICYCLAHAIMKHVEFGKGFYFLTDLQQYLNQYSKQDQKKLIENSVDSRNPYKRNEDDELEFTYNLGELPIMIPSKEKTTKTNEVLKQSDKAFEEIKQQIQNKQDLEDQI